MTDTLTLASADDRADLQTFLQRADRLGCDPVRLTSVGSHLVVTVCVLDKEGLLDTHPFVYGVRVFTMVPPGDGLAGSSAHAAAGIDGLFSTRALLDRLATRDVHLQVPAPQPRTAWAGMTPPRSGWSPVGSVSSADMVAAAEAGIAEVAQANGAGTNIVTQVRRTVWSRPLGAEQSAIPAGMAFAAFGLGFVMPAPGKLDGGESEAGELVTITTNGSWVRASTRRGDILAKR